MLFFGAPVKEHFEIPAMMIPVSKPLQIAAYYFPGFHRDQRNDRNKYPGFTEWDLVCNAKPRFPNHRQPRKPSWGCLDESDPSAMEKKIAAAADHGLDAFIFDWYHYDDGLFLEGALERGFLQAKNNHRIRFALMWANHDWFDIQGYNPADPARLLYPGKVKPETWDKITDLIIERYFGHPSYWLVEGKPYFSIYEISQFLESFGSVGAARKALDEFRQKAKEAGFPGLHINSILWGEPNLPGGKTPADFPQLGRDLALDSFGCYTWVHHEGLDYRKFPVTDYIDARGRYLAFWDEITGKLSIPYSPNVTVDWDNSPRAAPEADWSKWGAHVVTPTIIGSTPEAFRESLELVVQKLDASDTNPKIVTINAWNEWPEGSCLEPEERYGNGYLEALKAVARPKPQATVEGRTVR